MVQATRWRQDTRLQLTNPFQRVRFAPTFPSGGQADSAFGWTPIPIDAPGGIVPVGSQAGFMTTSGLSGGLGLDLNFGSVVTGFFAFAGIALGVWLAKKNLEG